MDRREETIAKNAKNAELKKLRAIGYQHVFGSAHGIKVLADLEIATGSNTSCARRAEFDANQTMFYEGQRSIYLYIKEILNTKVTENE